MSNTNEEIDSPLLASKNKRLGVSNIVYNPSSTLSDCMKLNIGLHGVLPMLSFVFSVISNLVFITITRQAIGWRHLVFTISLICIELICFGIIVSFDLEVLKLLSTLENEQESIMVISAEEAKIHLLKLSKSSLSKSSASLYLGLLESHNKNMKVEREMTRELSAFSITVGFILLLSVFNFLLSYAFAKLTTMSVYANIMMKLVGSLVLPFLDLMHLMKLKDSIDRVSAMLYVKARFECP